MYTLRTFTEDGEVNNFLGEQYEVVRREENYERFAVLFQENFGKPHVADLDPDSSEETKRCYAMVVNEKQEPIGIFKRQTNYIVTLGGKTFSNLTYK